MKAAMPTPATSRTFSAVTTVANQPLARTDASAITVTARRIPEVSKPISRAESVPPRKSFRKMTRPSAVAALLAAPSIRVAIQPYA